jgi:hypothetical protein
VAKGDDKEEENSPNNKLQLKNPTIWTVKTPLGITVSSVPLPTTRPQDHTSKRRRGQVAPSFGLSSATRSSLRTILLQQPVFLGKILTSDGHRTTPPKGGVAK